MYTVFFSFFCLLKLKTVILKFICSRKYFFLILFLHYTKNYISQFVKYFLLFQKDRNVMKILVFIYIGRHRRRGKVRRNIFIVSPTAFLIFRYFKMPPSTSLISIFSLFKDVYVLMNMYIWDIKAVNGLWSGIKVKEIRTDEW